jgi:hypothetical protein
VALKKELEQLTDDEKKGSFKAEQGDGPWNVHLASLEKNLSQSSLKQNHATFKQNSKEQSAQDNSENENQFKRDEYFNELKTLFSSYKQFI